MVMLEFNPDKLPRTMTREEWRSVHRWRRKMTRMICDQLDQALSDALLYGMGGVGHSLRGVLKSKKPAPC